jgi:hypothetical protein
MNLHQGRRSQGSLEYPEAHAELRATRPRKLKEVSSQRQAHSSIAIAAQDSPTQALLEIVLRTPPGEA